MKAEEHKKALQEKKQAWQILLNSSAGAELVQWFVDNFDHDKMFVADNQYQTAYRLGQRDVARFLRELKERKNDG